MRDISALIIHHSASPLNTTIQDIRKWHVEDNGWMDIGYHYVIHADGTTHIGRPIHEMGAHCLGFNEDSIGICVVGDNTKPGANWTWHQMLELTVLCGAWRTLIPRIKIAGHKDYNPGTACPGVDIKDILPAYWFK